jgi:hypothetical protein
MKQAADALLRPAKDKMMQLILLAAPMTHAFMGVVPLEVDEAGRVTSAGQPYAGSPDITRLPFDVLASLARKAADNLTKAAGTPTVADELAEAC